MPENKNTRIEIRLTEIEKQQLKDYIKTHNTTISKLFREFLQKILEGEK